MQRSENQAITKRKRNRLIKKSVQLVKLEEINLQIFECNTQRREVVRKSVKTN